MLQQLTPITQHRFRLFPLRSPLLRESLRFLFLQVLRWFSSPRLTSYTYFIQCKMIGIIPIGLPHSATQGSNGCLLLTLAFRSLPRPSSSDSAKASTMDPFSLDHIIHFPISIYVKEQKPQNVILEAWGIEPQTFSLQS